MNNNLSLFIQNLEKAASLNITADDLSDTLWLAYQMALHSPEAIEARPHESSSSSVEEVGKQSPSNTISAGSSIQEKEPSTKPAPVSALEVYAHTQKSPKENERSTGGMPIRMPAPLGLTGSLALGSALRPLRQRGPSRKTLKLNEQATVRRIAEQRKRYLIPILEPALVRRFELTLIIDDGASMIFWQQVITEVRILLERLGAFYDLRLWRLVTKNKEAIQLYAGRDSAPTEQRGHDPKELIDPTGQRLFLVVSDCVSPAWHSGKVQEVLELWGKKNLVSLLQVYPTGLWPRTALRAAETVYLSASAFGVANKQLQVQQGPEWSPEEFFPPIPVVLLDEKSLAPWAKMIMGNRNQCIPGVVFGRNVESLLAISSPPAQEEPSAQERVDDFRAAASPLAYKLARLLSATPITLPIVRIIQKTMLPKSTQVHVAEVFLGGLLQEMVPDIPHARSEEIEYKFHPGVQEVLYRTLLMPDERRVGVEVSMYFIEHFGIPRDFSTLLANSAATEKISIESGPLAKIAVDAWRRAGGWYAHLAEMVAEQVEVEVQGKTSSELLAVARAITDKAARMQALIKLLPELSGQRQDQALHEAFEIMLDVVNKEDAIRAWLAYLPDAPEEVKIEIIREILKTSGEITNIEMHFDILDQVLQYLPNDWKDEEARIVFLDVFQQYLADMWNITVLQQKLLEVLHSTANSTQQISILRRLQEISVAEMQPAIEQELSMLVPVLDMEPLAAETVASEANKDIIVLPSTSPLPVLPLPGYNPISRGESTFQPYTNTRTESSRIGSALSVKCRCPSCFEEIYIGDCRIVSGITSGKALKAAPRGSAERFLARIRPEPLNGRKYTLELARRECTSCGYYLPYNIEQVPSVTLALVGETLSGKSHYMASFLHQLNEWIGNSSGFARYTCLTPDVFKRFTYEHLEPLYTGRRQLVVTQPAKFTADPLIYTITTRLSPKHPTTSFNLIMYDTSGEDFREERLVNFARFVFNATAFIFVIDPTTMQPIMNQLTPSLQKNLQPMLDIVQDRRAVEILNRTLDVFKRYQGYTDISRLPETPVAVMLSKSDLLKSVKQPFAYSFLQNPQYGSKLDLQDINNVDQEVKALLTYYGQGDFLSATDNFKRANFFATSATGEPPDQDGNFQNVEPCRCLDPVLWILYSLGLIERVR